MSEKKGSPAHLSDLFLEEAAELLGISNKPEAVDKLPVEPPPTPAPKVLTMPLKEEAAPEEAFKAYWRMLRAFFRSGKNIQDPEWAAFPALLTPYRNRQYLNQQFPAWMADADTFEKEKVNRAFIPLHELLAQAVEAFAPNEGEARILKDNLLRLQLIIIGKLHLVDDTFKAYPVLEESLKDLVAKLAIGGGEGEAFEQDIAQLKKQLPKTGVLIPFSTHAPLHLLACYLNSHLSRERSSLRAEIHSLLIRLKDLLTVEQEKRPGAQSAEHLQSGLGFASEFLNFDELSAVLPAGGAEVMPEERLQRIEQIVATLEQADPILFNTDAILLLGHRLGSQLSLNWQKAFPHSVIEMAAEGQSCTTAMAVFDQRMEAAARLFGAFRMGKLEADNHYLPEAHSEFFAHFDWRQFTNEEMAACPPVLLLADARILMKAELDDYSRMLSSGRPIKALLFQEEEAGTATPDDTSALAFRPEPGALSIAHRNVYFFQGSAIHLDYFFHGVREAFSSFSPAILHLLVADVEKSGFLWMSAAVEGREFPGFTYDSRLGPRWGSRFDIQNNPQPDQDWPEHDLPILDEAGKEASLRLSFTYADFAAQHPGFAGQFHLVPPQFWSEDLAPLADFLTFPPEESYAKVPYIWVADSQSILQKAAVAWPVVLTCRERLDFWHYLQENAGIHSFHADIATEKARQEAEARAEAQIATLNAAHQQEVERVKEEAARQAMEQLADVLLGLEPLAGLDAIASPPAPARPAAKSPEVVVDKPAPAAEAETPSPEPQEAEEESLPLGEAWIETPLCTSCNECTETNNRIFKYNAEKQAYVADPKGGPFADIVRAAENCPARIIHPGAPADPKEPGLEELIKRAAPFN